LLPKVGVVWKIMATPQQPLRAEAEGGADEEQPSPTDGYIPTFYVGHHESQRPLPITDFVLRQAQEVGVCSSIPQDSFQQLITIPV